MPKPIEKKEPAATKPFSIVDDAKSPMAEAFRAARTNLLFAGVDSPHRRFLVTSAIPKEGKTTTVVNLGMTMALAGSRTLVIDTDLRRPALHRSFQIASKVGLTSVLGDQADLQSAIQPTRLDSLFVLPSGPSVANPAELVGSRRMAELVDRLQEQYDILIFDSPPVITVADAMVLVSLSDGVILVVRSGSAPHEVVTRAKTHLESVKANIVGVMLNAFDAKRQGYYSSYYYYYSYTYGYGDSGSDGKRTQ